MRIYLFSILLLSGAMLSAQPYNVGQMTMKYQDTSRNRPLTTEIWYPTHAEYRTEDPVAYSKSIFKTIKAVPNAAIASGKFPLLMVSHGTGGNRFSLTWLIEKLVAEGYVVAATDHYGNSTFHKIPREFLKWWERAIDIKYVLTEILSDDNLKTRIDEAKIGSIGFSLGGYTNIALAGGYLDRTLPKDINIELAPEFPETEEQIDYEHDSLILHSFHTYKDHVKDDRIKAFFVMAPAIGFGFHTKEQTQKISAPVFIVAGRGDKNTVIKNNALKYHQLIKTSRLYLFDKPVGHYVFLNEATGFGKKVAPEICVDPPGVDRKAIHEKATQLAMEFFKNDL